MSNWGALANLDHDAVIDRIASGEIMRTIAAELGVIKQSLRERLMKHPRYQQAIASQAESMVEQAVAEMMDPELPADVPVIARARARVDTAFKWAAARDPANWGQKQQTITINVLQADAALLVQAGALLDRLRTVASQDSYPQAIEGDLPNNEAESA